MVTKMLIQVISVVTLVFGTCYQSVQALASNTKRIDIQSARLIDKDNTAPATVKAGSEHKLVVDLTISNKDGDHESGTTQFWVPQSQLKLLKDEATFEANEAAENAHLNYKKLANNQLQLSWDKVTNVANFRVALPVKVKQVMTESVLSIAVGRETSDLQPLTVLAADATDDAVGEITGDPGLPKAILADLDQYLDALRVQEEEAAAKREAEEQAKLEEAKKAEAEAKEKAEAEAKEKAEKEAAAKKEKEQQEVDKEKEAAKTETTMKTRSTRTTERSDDGEKRESKDEETATGKDIGKRLIEVAKEDTPESFFNSIILRSGDKEQEVSEDSKEINMEDYAGKEFDLIYNWNMDTLRDKLNPKGSESQFKLEVGDFYTFRIYGLEKLSADGQGEIKSNDTKLASYTYKNMTDDNNKDYQEITIIFDQEAPLQTSSKFEFEITQKLLDNNPVIFEHNEGAIVTGVPDRVMGSIEKSGKFEGDQIEWTVTVKADSFSKGVQFKDITITDVLGEGHDYVLDDEGKFIDWKIMSNREDVTGKFDADKPGIFKGRADAEIEFEHDLVITFLTKPKAGVEQTTFKNTVSAVVGEQKTNSAEYEVSSFEVSKKSGEVVKEVNNDGNTELLYKWQVKVDLNGIEISKDSLESISIVDTLKGNHKFSQDRLQLAVYPNEDKTGADLTEYFKVVEVEDNHLELVIDPKKLADTDELDALVTELSNNKKELYIFYRTVQTAGDMNSAANTVEVSVNGMVASVEQENTNNKGKLITKEGQYNQNKEGAAIDWTLTVNEGGWQYSELTVVDKLPADIGESDLSDFEIGGKTVSINGLPVTLDDGTTVEVIFDDQNNEIKLTFTNIKRSYKVTFTTNHDWDDGAEKKITNTATATTSNGYYQTSDKTVDINKRITGNAFKDGENILTNSIDAGRNTVQWKVGFGTRLDDKFSKNDISTVTIEDTLNGDSHQYLSFPKDASAYKLYEIKEVGNSINSSQLGNEIVNEPENEVYKIDLVPDSKDQNKMTIKITFTGDEQYQQLALVFETPIDLDAWIDKDTDKPSELDKYVFKNSAKVSYEGFDPVTVDGESELAKNGIYGFKTGTAVKDSRRLDWQAILNADGKQLTNVEITDTLSSNHEHSVYDEDIKLYAVDVKHYQENGEFTIKVVEGTKVAIKSEDYTVEKNANDPSKITIKLNQPLTTALLLEYQTTRVGTDGEQVYTNEVKLSSNEVLIDTKAEKSFKASGVMWGFDVNFKKIIKNDKNRPLGGAKFVLQEKVATADENDPNAWRDATDIHGNAIGEITSPESGDIVIRDLRTYSKFKLIETASAEGYDHDIEPIEFNKADVDGDWQATKYYIQNWPVRKRTSLSINKEATGLGNRTFTFTVSAKVNGEIDTSFNGEYKRAQGNETVTFKNGVATFNLAKDETVKIVGLPVYLPGEDSDKRKYEIKEVKTADDDFETQVSIDDGKPTSSVTTKDIELKDDGDQHTAVFFHNSLTTGNFILSKQVVATDEQLDPKAVFEFKVAATQNGKEYSSGTREFEAQRFDADGNPVSTKEKVKFDNGKLIITDPVNLETVSLKAGEQYVVNDLPEGLSLKATELNPDDYTVTSRPAGQKDNGGYVTGAVIVPDKTVDLNASITVINTLPVGNLKLNKNVLNQKDGDEDTEFEFTLAVEDKDTLRGQTVFKVDGLKGQDDVEFKRDQTNDQYLATLNLKHNDSATIKGLPQGAQVVVTEKNHDGFKTTYRVTGSDVDNQNGDWKDQTTAGAAVTISDAKTATVSYRNTRPVIETGNLQVNKYVASSQDKELNATYTFDLKVADNDVSQVNGNTYKVTGNDKQPNLTFKDGKAVLYVQGSGHAAITGLPVGITVSVKERVENADLVASWRVGVDDDYQVLTDTNYPKVEVKADKSSVVSYKNTRDPDGELRVEKVIKGHIDASQQFKFAVRSADPQVPLTKEYRVRIYDQENNVVKDTDVKAINGDVNIKLMGGSSATISGLPLATYQVQENNTGINNMITTWSLNHEGGTTTGTTATLEDALTENGVQTVTFTNEVPEGDLRLEKIAEGTYSATDSIKFTIRADNRLTGKYNGVRYQSDSTNKDGDVSVEFNRGWAEVSLKPGQYIMISDLPTQRYRVIEERQADDVVTTWEADAQTGDGRRSDWITTKANHTVSVTFTNRIDVGSVTLNKWVASQHDNDLKTDYEFTLQADDVVKVAGKDYEVKGHAETTHVTFDNDGKAKLTMNHDKPVTINGLPDGLELTVIETPINGLVATWRVNNTGDYVELADAEPIITIDDSRAQVVSYKNTRDPDGQLRVEKQVTGAAADEDASYNFVIDALDITDPNDPDKLLDLNGTYSIQLYQSGTDKLLHDDDRHVKFVDGQADLSLQADQYAVINGLPLHTYRVSEDDPGVDNMTTTWSLNGGQMTPGLQTEAHELTENGVMTVVFNNIVRTGDLSIEKQLTGAVTDADEQLTFDFTVTAHRDAVGGGMEVDTDYDRQHSATLTAADGTETTLRRDFENGELTVSLKTGERLTIHNLDENQVVTVTEAPLADFITTHRIGTDAVAAGSETREIKIADEVTKRVTFINDKPAMPEMTWLSLTKTVLGDAAETDRGFDFTIQLTDHLQEPVTGMVKIVTSTVANPAVSSELLLDENGMGTVTLQHNETIKVEVPNGATYQITETDYSADGYVTTTSHGGRAEQSGLMVTGIAHQVDPSKALVVYYNRADSTTTEDDLAHTDTEDDQAMPELVGPATDGSDSTGTGSGLTGSMPQAHTSTGGMGASGSVAPQAYTSSGSKGFLPQTGDFLRAHWVAVLGWLLLMVLIGMMVWRYRLNKR